MTDFKKAQNKKSSVKMLLCSVLLTVFIVLIISFTAALILGGKESCSADIKVYSLGVLIISALISGFINSKREGLKESMLSSLIMCILMLILGLILSSGKLVGSSLMNYGCFLLVSLAGAYLGRSKSKAKRKRRR